MAKAVRIVHLSDLHLKTGNEWDGITTSITYVLTKIYQESHPSGGPVVVVITGDLTQDGADVYYQKALQVVNQMRQNGYHVLTVPGNHDIRACYKYDHTKDGKYQHMVNFANRFYGGDQSFPRYDKIHNVAFIGLNTVEGYLNRRWVEPKGKLGSAQINRLDQQLDMIKREGLRYVVICMHHSPFSSSLVDGFAFWKVLAKREYRELPILLLSGHLHSNFRFKKSDNFMALDGGTSTGRKTGEQCRQIREVTITEDNKLTRRFILGEDVPLL